MATREIEPVRQSVVVKATRDEAFRIFVDEIDSWWPLATHSIGRQRATSCYIEGREGGRIYETLDDGTLHPWGTVTAWQPAGSIVFSWHPGRDAATAQEVELRFTAHDDGTLVELEHRRWERLGDEAEEMRNAYSSGWPGVLARFSERCAD